MWDLFFFIYLFSVVVHVYLAIVFFLFFHFLFTHVALKNLLFFFYFILSFLYMYYLPTTNPTQHNQTHAHTPPKSYLTHNTRHRTHNACFFFPFFATYTHIFTYSTFSKTIFLCLSFSFSFFSFFLFVSLSLFFLSLFIYRSFFFVCFVYYLSIFFSVLFVVLLLLFE